MKMFKRFAAALLAGIMVLAMLTACGGTGNGNDAATFEDKVEQAYMAKLNETFGVNFENDADIKTLAVDHIEKMASKETLNVNDLWKKDKTTQVQVMICNQFTKKGFVKFYYEADKAETITPDQDNINTLKATVDLLSVFGKKVELTALGVGVKTIDGKTYVAIGFKVKG